MPTKRPAPSQAGSKPKKQHLDKDAAEKAPREKKRSRPVTAPVLHDGDSGIDDEDDENWEDDDEDDLGGDDSPAAGGDDEDAMQVDAPKPKDPNAARDSHRAQRALLQERKGAKPHSSVLADAKRVWSLAHQKNIPKDVRARHIAELMDVVRGKVHDVVCKHDASRIVQTLVRYGGRKERDEVAAELKGHYLALAQSKYSKFLVTKLVRTCPAHRPAILLELTTHVVRLLLHREASSVVADAYELYANAHERALLLRDFYGKEVALFAAGTKAGGAGASEEQKDDVKKGLKGVLAGVDAPRRKRILAALKENLLQIFNNPDKGAVAHAIVHRALWEYLAEVNALEDEAEGERLRREIFDSCQELLAEMVHTKDGSCVVREFIAYGSAKDRKQIIKTLKPHIARICTDKEAQLVLFTALDVIDDTKLSAKALVSEIVARAAELYDSAAGRRSVLYLLVPRSPRHFTHAQIALLAATDAVRARTSKKDEGARREEIRRAASVGLIEVLEDAQRVERLLRDPGGSLVVGEVMLYAEGDKTKAMQALLAPLTSPYPSPTDIPHIIDVPHAARVYKTLLNGGHFSQKTHAVARVPGFAPVEFAAAWVGAVGRDATVAMACGGGGTFVVAALCQRVAEEGAGAEKQALGAWFGGGVRGQIERAGVKGRDVLVEALDALGV